MLIFSSIKVKKIGFFVIAAFLLFTIFFFADSTMAATSTIRGFAWWGSANRYVYFNCLDDEIGDRLNVSENLWNGGSLFRFYSTPCTDLVHGVLLNDNGLFSGRAWNQNKGLITFDRTDASSNPPDGYGFNSNCPSTCNPSTNCLACYREDQQKVYGWAQVMNDDTWIRLDSTGTPPVMLQGWDTDDNPIVAGNTNILAGDFAGTASSNLGDLSFNCETESGDPSTCLTRSYKVYSDTLEIGHMSAPNLSFAQACLGSALQANLRWYKKSGQQTAYQVIIGENPTFTLGNPATYLCDSGKVISTAGNFLIPNSNPDCDLDYNTSYYWWVRLYDGANNPTQWYKFGGDDCLNSRGDTHSNPPGQDASPCTFKTYQHEFPTPYFIWDPYEILVGTTTKFTSQSQFYTASQPALPQTCYGANCSYSWSVSNPSSTVISPTASATDIFFYVATGTSVNLTVTDAENYYCNTSTVLNINYGLPVWHETKALDNPY